VNSNLSFVPLQQASLCLDCDTITSGHTNCQACGSRALLSLARVLSHHSTDSSGRMNTTPVPISFPLRQRHNFHGDDTNTEQRLERVNAAPMRLAIGMGRHRHETFES
jgi:hypothetical protein